LFTCSCLKHTKARTATIDSAVIAADWQCTETRGTCGVERGVHRKHVAAVRFNAKVTSLLEGQLVHASPRRTNPGLQVAHRTPEAE
jgi:hypothetical protein